MDAAALSRAGVKGYGYVSTTKGRDNPQTVNFGFDDLKNLKLVSSKNSSGQ